MPGWTKKHGGAYLFIVLVAIAAVGAAAYLYLQTRFRRAGAGDAVGTLVVATDAGPLLVILDRLGHEEVETRVTTIDARSGERLAQRYFRGHASCAVAAAGRIWCQGGRIALHDARTLETVVALGDAIERAGVGAPLEKRWFARGGTAVHELTNGRVAVLDATTLEVSSRERESRDAFGTGLAAASPSCGGAELPPRAESGAGPPLIQARPALDAVGGGAVDGLVLHAASVAAATDHPLLSRLDTTGAAVWTVDLGKACESLLRVDDLVVVTTRSSTYRAQGIDLATGELRWRVSF